MARNAATPLPGPPASSAALLHRAQAALDGAVRCSDDGERFRMAHLAALRTAAAVLAERGRPNAARRKLVSVWVLIDAVAPEFADWARYFAAGAATRSAVEAGARHAASPRAADDQVRAASDFLRLVQQSLGMLATPLAS
jgi:SAV_6107-like HEPN